MTDTTKIEKRLRDVAAAYPEDIFPPLTDSERKDHSALISRASGCMGRFLSKHMLEAADTIARLREERDRIQNQICRSFDGWSQQLGWGLTGSQPECWAMMDASVEELVRLRRLLGEAREAMSDIRGICLTSVGPGYAAILSRLTTTETSDE